MLDSKLSVNEIESAIHEVIFHIIEQKGETVAKLDNASSLANDLGFESLDLAQLVSMLEMRVDIDPFSRDIAITSIRTVGDLRNAYCQFAEPSGEKCFSTRPRLAPRDRGRNRGQMRARALAARMPQG